MRPCSTGLGNQTPHYRRRAVPILDALAGGWIVACLCGVRLAFVGMPHNAVQPSARDKGALTRACHNIITHRSWGLRIQCSELQLRRHGRGTLTCGHSAQIS